MQGVNFTRRQVLLAGAGAALGLSAGVRAQPGDYPSRPVRLVLGFPPGGATDNSARLLAQAMSEALGQSIVVDNRPGASGIIAAEHVARSAPDGYTLFYTTSTIHGINPNVIAKLSYDPVNDFTPVAFATTTPLLVLVNNELGVDSVSELIALAKSRPGKLSYASAGPGSTAHLAAAMFCRQAGIEALHVPYKGSSPALTDLMAGHVDFTIDTVSASLPLVQNQKLRALAITTLERSAALPDVPTVHASGVPGYQVAAWGGFLLPAGAPAPVVARLNEAVNTALRHPDVVRRTQELGSESKGGTPEAFGQWIRDELTRWKAAVAAAGVQPQ